MYIYMYIYIHSQCTLTVITKLSVVPWLLMHLDTWHMVYSYTMMVSMSKTNESSKGHNKFY